MILLLNQFQNLYLIKWVAVGRSWQVVLVSEVDLWLELLVRDLEWSLLAGGRYPEVDVSTCLTVSLFVDSNKFHWMFSGLILQPTSKELKRNITGLESFLQSG